MAVDGSAIKQLGSEVHFDTHSFLRFLSISVPVDNFIGKLIISVIMNAYFFGVWLIFEDIVEYFLVLFAFSFIVIIVVLKPIVGIISFLPFFDFVDFLLGEGSWLIFFWRFFLLLFFLLLLFSNTVVDKSIIEEHFGKCRYHVNYNVYIFAIKCLNLYIPSTF